MLIRGRMGKNFFSKVGSQDICLLLHTWWLRASAEWKVTTPEGSLTPVSRAQHRQQAWGWASNRAERTSLVLGCSHCVPVSKQLWNSRVPETPRWLTVPSQSPFMNQTLTRWSVVSSQMLHVGPQGLWGFWGLPGTTLLLRDTTVWPTQMNNPSVG